LNTKELLKKQMTLLSERSKQEVSSRDLFEMSLAMVQIAGILGTEEMDGAEIKRSIEWLAQAVWYGRANAPKPEIIEKSIRSAVFKD
jgi:hypothetical protein